jgi:hypothetical protein
MMDDWRFFLGACFGAGATLLIVFRTLPREKKFDWIEAFAMAVIGGPALAIYSMAIAYALLYALLGIIAGVKFALHAIGVS